MCVCVCPHPELIRGQFHPAPHCSPTLSQLGHRERLTGLLYYYLDVSNILEMHALLHCIHYCINIVLQCYAWLKVFISSNYL